MKTFVILLFSLIISFTCFSQGNNVTTADTFIIQDMISAVKSIWSCINLKFAIVFLLLTWLINDSTDAANTAKFMNWFAKIPKILRVLILSVLLIAFYAWVFRFNTRTDIYNMFISVLFTMVAYKIGINKILKWLSKKIGLQLD